LLKGVAATPLTAWKGVPTIRRTDIGAEITKGRGHQSRAYRNWVDDPNEKGPQQR
jgi:hypothetical protein